jgi:hypothetical protein
MITRRGFLAAWIALVAAPIAAKVASCSFCSGRICADGTCKMARVAKLPEGSTWAETGFYGNAPHDLMRRWRETQRRHPGAILINITA